MDTAKPAAASSANDNKRVAPRQKTLKSAKVVHLTKWLAVDCAVRDISATGAKLQCKDQISVPDEMRFVLISDNTIRKAKVAWRHDDLIGIEFTSEPERAPPRKF
jgi:hypothetical protein